MMSPSGYLPLIDAVKRCANAWACEPREAYEQLRPKLWEGSIKTVSIRPDGSAEHPRVDWGTRDNDRAYIEGTVAFNCYPARPVHRPAFVSSQDLTDLLSANAKADASEKSPDDGKKDKGGRPPKIGLEAFWMEACRLIYSAECDPAEKTQEEFINALVQWSAENMTDDPYLESTVRGKVKALWRRLKPRRGST